MNKDKSALAIMLDLLTRKGVYDEYNRIDEQLASKRRELDSLNTELLELRREKQQLDREIEKRSEQKHVSCFTPEEISVLIDRKLLDTVSIAVKNYNSSLTKALKRGSKTFEYEIENPTQNYIDASDYLKRRLQKEGVKSTVRVERNAAGIPFVSFCFDISQVYHEYKQCAKGAAVVLNSLGIDDALTVNHIKNSLTATPDVNHESEPSLN